jgi:hypothetical protein
MSIFQELTSSGFDEFTLPPEEWQAIFDGIPADLLDLRISTVAARLGLKWPQKSDKWCSFTIRESWVDAAADLLEMQSLGRGKFRTIVLCVLHVAEYPNDYSSAENLDNSKQHVLTINGDEWRDFGSSHWESIVESIPVDSYQIAIRTFANDLGLKWPATGWDDFSVEDCLIPSFQELASQRGMGNVKMRTIVRVLAHLAKMSEIGETVESSDDIWNHPVIQSINERERAVFERRILRLTSKATLEELGSEYLVCRERIRQIENSILNKIRGSGLVDKLSSALEDYKINIVLPELSKDKCLLLVNLESFASGLPSKVALSITLEYGTVFSWLSSFAIECPRGWYFGTQSEFNWIEKAVSQFPAAILLLPIDLVSSITGVAADGLIPFVRLTQFAANFQGCLIPYRVGRAHAMRAIVAYNYALSHERRFWAIEDLFEGATGNRDQSEVRNYRLSIQSSNRIFVSTFGYAVCLGHGQICSSVFPATGEKRKIQRDKNPESDTRRIIRELLTEEWPITKGNVARLFNRRSKEQNISNSSYIPLIASDPSSIRLAPGVYAPYEYTDDAPRLERARRLSLSERELRNYCFAKRSGETTQDLFPLWDYDQEQRWYRKLRKREGDVLLGTLVSVARQDQWPEQCNREKLELLEQGVSAQFGISPYWLSERSYRGPDLSETLVVMRYAYEVASISWIRANYILSSKQITDEVGVTAVILGIALGLLDDTKRPWWEPVPASRDFLDVWESIESLFLHRDLPTWEHPVIKAKLQGSLAKAEVGKLAFVTPSSLRMILNELQNHPEGSTESTDYV